MNTSFRTTHDSLFSNLKHNDFYLEYIYFIKKLYKVNNPTTINSFFMIKQMLSKISLFLLFCVGFTSLSFASEDIFERKILSIGCHNVDSICYVTVSGENFGSTLGCNYTSTNQFRFDASTPIGKRTYASLYGAFLTKKTISANLSGCSTDGRPSIAWYEVYQR